MIKEMPEAGPRDSAGVYQRMVAEQILEQRAVTLELLRQAGIGTREVPANQLTIAVVDRYLELKVKGRL